MDDVEIANWERVRPRIPDTPQRRKLERQRSVREIVFGAQDGILTTLGLVTGVGVADANRHVVLLTGFLAMLAGALSMGVGEYLGGKSEREVVQAAIDVERGEMAADPQGEFAEQVAYYRLKGFSAQEAQMIVNRLTHHPDIYLYEMMRDEFGIDPREADARSLRGPLSMGLSFSIGSLLPIVAFLLPAAMPVSIGLSLLFAIAGLFCVGYYAGLLGTRRPVAKGIEIVLFGLGVFVLSYLAGHYIPPLFGYRAVTVGG
jgi:VIT1/CCC1 family predicted Fe2+/Mn2+ transporter